jgi:hypothetical protein
MLILQELHQEVRRLFIAGSGLAEGDVRLTKLIAPLEKLGENAPVFRKLAETVRQATTAKGEDAAVKLLELGTLLHSILYTQGQADIKGQEEPFPAFLQQAGSTDASYRKLKPLLSALTERGQGRQAVIMQANEEFLFRDMRTYIPAIEALEDPYQEIGDYLEEKVIPAEIGPAALPILQSRFRPQGGKGDARKLRLIHTFLKESGREIYLDALEQGSTEVKSAAVEIMSGYEEYEPILLDQASDRKKDVRRAALMALATLNTERAVKRIWEAFTGKDRDIAIEPVAASRNPWLVEQLLAFTGNALEQLVQSQEKDKDREAAAAALTAGVEALRNQHSPQVTELLIRMLETPAFHHKSVEQLPEWAARQLLLERNPETDQYLLTLKNARNGRLIRFAFLAARRTLSPKQLYDEYEAHFLSKQGSAKILMEAMQEATMPLRNIWQPEPQKQNTQEWDPRWAGLFVRLGQTDLVCRLAQRPDNKAVEFLLEKLQSKSNSQYYSDPKASIVLALYKLGCKETHESLLSSLDGKHYISSDMLVLLELLPSRYADRLDKLAESMRYAEVKREVEEIAQRIRQNPTDINAEDVWHVLTGSPESQEPEKGGFITWIKSKLS